MSNTDNFVDSESELALLAMDGGRWASAAEHVEGALDAIEAHRLQDYAACLLAFAAAARLTVHRGDSTEADRHLAQAMRARPTSTFVLPLPRRAPTTATGQGLPRQGRRDGRRHLLKEIDDVLSHRPDLGALVDEVDEFRQILTSSARAGSAGGAPLPPPSFACSRTCRHT
jgi:LuxR family transcriptional regulator, maltose regulon positive regulatory protein